MPSEEFHDGPGEDVVTIASDHMSGAPDVDEIDLREAFDEFGGPLLGDEIAHLPAHKKHRHVVGKDRFNRGVEAIYFGHFDGRTRRSAVDELRIPMPVPASVAVAEVCLEAVQIGWPGP